jgi:hypothetical protein
MPTRAQHSPKVSFVTNEAYTLDYGCRPRDQGSRPAIEVRCAGGVRRAMRVRMARRGTARPLRGAHGTSGRPPPHRPREPQAATAPKSLKLRSRSAHVAPERSWEIPREVGNGACYRETVTGPARSFTCSMWSIGEPSIARYRGGVSWRWNFTSSPRRVAARGGT